MAVEDRTGVCATCDLAIYRQPNHIPDTPDSWFHQRTTANYRDEPWLANPHDPTPKEAPNDSAEQG